MNGIQAIIDDEEHEEFCLLKHHKLPLSPLYPWHWFTDVDPHQRKPKDELTIMRSIT